MQTSARDATKTVLLLGASHLTYTDTDTSATIPALVEADLASRLPDVSWRCEVRPLFFGPRMPELAERHARDLRPLAVVLSLVQDPFSDDVPIAVIRRRWPRFYPRARKLAERLKTIAGGPGIQSPRGWVYRAPRRLLAALVGAEPEVDVEDAVRFTTATIDSLLRLEEPVVVCGFSFTPHSPAGTRKAVYDQRLALFRQRLRAYCEPRHVAVYDRNEALRSRGLQYESGRDRRYASIQTRRAQALEIADIVIASQEP